MPALADGAFLEGASRDSLIVIAVVVALTIFLAWFSVYAVLIPTLLIAATMFLAAFPPASPNRFRHWLHAKPLPFWIMTWFLIVSIVLTVIGTWFRGAGWAWVWP